MNISSCQTLEDHGASRGTIMKRCQWAFALVVEPIQSILNHLFVKHIFLSEHYCEIFRSLSNYAKVLCLIIEQMPVTFF